MTPLALFSMSADLGCRVLYMPDRDAGPCGGFIGGPLAMGQRLERAANAYASCLKVVPFIGPRALLAA